MVRTNSVRRADGHWLNSNVFREEALKFMKNGYYCPDPAGSPSYKEYWDEQLRRCKEGYEVDGEKITGHHYSYLNFSQIRIVELKDDTIVSSKKTTFPDFWDGDYDYYWSLEIAKNGVTNKESLLTDDETKEKVNRLGEEEKRQEWIRLVAELRMKVRPHSDFLGGGNHMIIGKSRRKGYSYKNADICKNIYNTVRESLTLIGAFDKKYLYPRGTMGMASAYLSFLNKYTAWSKAREYVDKQDHRRASFEERKDGISIESGYHSEIMALTFADNPDAAKGKDAILVLLEEAGVFPNLIAAYNATKPGLEAGKYITGQILIFGTGGDMESGTADFAHMFYNPIQFGLMPFVNIWDENAENTYCGFFHPVYLNMEGFYDKMGNSDIDGARTYEMSVRQKLIKASTSSTVIQDRVQEFPMSPSEAFLSVSTNDFPIVELRQQYNKVVRENLHLKLGQACSLIRDEGKEGRVGKVRAMPDLEGIIQPLWDYRPKTKDLRGGVVIYEYPIPNTPKGLYKIGFDPYRQDHSSAIIPSLAAVYVYKGIHKFSPTRDTIVAQYVGRPYDPDVVNRIVEMLAELYNTEIMYENEITHVKDYFIRKKKVHLLALQPDTVIAKLIDHSKVKRIWGMHMIDKIKDGGEKYIKQWLLEERDFNEDGEVTLNLETIYDPALLEELILYNRKGNFDRVMAFMMVMFQIAEEEEAKEYGDKEESSNAADLITMMEMQYRNTSVSVN